MGKILPVLGDFHPEFGKSPADAFLGLSGFGQISSGFWQIPSQKRKKPSRISGKLSGF